MTKGHPNQSFIQAFSPPLRGSPCFPTLRFAAHWTELTRPFRAVTERSAFSPLHSPFRRDNIPLRFRFSPFEGELGGCSSAVGHLSFRAKRRISFCYFWLDPKVTQRSRLRALHTPSRRSQVGKSGNSLRSDSLIFFRPARCSVGSPPEAQGRN